MTTPTNDGPLESPLESLEQWEDDVLRRYPDPDSAPETDAGFRVYGETVRPEVREFYRLNHRYQTFDFVQTKRAEYLTLERRKMSIWDALLFLNTLVDDSDPDTELTHIEHLLQTAEAIRSDGHPRWFVLTGLIHDLGKILCLFGEPQWAVVGDTFPVGCDYSDKIVFAEYFAENSDTSDPKYQSPLGVYTQNCGLKNVFMSWGHDEYLYHVVKEYLPPPALAMIRYHSFYAAHRENEYTHLLNDTDATMLNWVRKFNPYDLYTKHDTPPDVDSLKPYYDELINEFIPGEVRF